MTSRGERGIWQLRYWEHTIRDDRDFTTHMDYTHFNRVRRSRGAPGGLAAFVVSSVRHQWAISCRVEGRQR